jgi:alanine dehydrogenase
MLLINQNQVAELLPMDECMELMVKALTALAEGRVVLPLRTVMRLPDTPNAFGSMPAFASGIDDGGTSLAVKIITVFPGNEASPYDSHQGAVLLFETTHGRLAAIMDASSITAIRTAAVSGVATRLLARDDAQDLAILGAGVQASTHLEAMRLARKIDRVRVWSRTPDRLAHFVASAKRRYGVTIEPCSSVQSAVDGADIICTTTASREPVLRSEWVKDGAHINAVGASLRTARELESALVARARLYVDRRESALNEAGDFLIPRDEGLITDAHIRGEIGELLTKRATGRTSTQEVTLFKSLGIAVEDLAAAGHVHRAAIAKGIGQQFDLGGERHV